MKLYILLIFLICANSYAEKPLVKESTFKEKDKNRIIRLNKTSTLEYENKVNHGFILISKNVLECAVINIRYVKGQYQCLNELELDYVMSKAYQDAMKHCHNSNYRCFLKNNRFLKKNTKNHYTYDNHFDDNIRVGYGYQTESRLVINKFDSRNLIQSGKSINFNSWVVKKDIDANKNNATLIEHSLRFKAIQAGLEKCYMMGYSMCEISSPWVNRANGPYSPLVYFVRITPYKYDLEN